MSIAKMGRFSRAARFIYLNRLCFNGLYRTNRKGQFNVPIGTRTGAFPDAKSFEEMAKLLRGATLVTGDFEATLNHAEENDFVYMDPPYASVTHKDRNEYGVGSFKPCDIPRLIRSLERIHGIGARFLLSYSTAPDFLSQLRRSRVRRFSIKRSIASEIRFRRAASEVLLTNEDLFPL